MQRGGCHPEDGCRDGNGFAGAKFHYLAANVVRKRTGKRFFPPYAIRKIGGVKIGFIGMTTKATPSFLSPTAAAGLRFRGEALTANHYARVLKHRGVHAIVVLLHEGGFAVRPDVSAERLPRPQRAAHRTSCKGTTHDVDLFLTGHTHVAYNCVIDGRHVTSAGSYGRLITKVELQIGRRSGEVQHVDTRNWVVGQDVPPAPDITALINRYTRFAAPLRDRLVGQLARRAGRTRDPSGEMKMGNLVADAQRAATGAAVAFVNPGIVRAGLPAGDDHLRASVHDPAVRHHARDADDVRQPDPRDAQAAVVRAHRARASCSRPRTCTTRGAARPRSRCSASPAPTRPTRSSTSRSTARPVPPYAAYRVTVNSSLANGGDRFSVIHGANDPIDGDGDADALANYLEPTLDTAPLVPPARDRITLVP